MKLEKMEDENIEYKVKLNFDDSYERWLKTLCGFANSEGGSMFVGVNDDLHVVGFKRSEIDSIKRSVEAYCRNHTSPILKCDFSTLEVEGKTDCHYLKISVKKREGAITWLVDSSHSPFLYVRHNGSSEFATIEEQQNLLLRQRSIGYDQTVLGISSEEANFDELGEEYRKSNHNQALTEKLLISFGLLSPDKHLTYAGLLFSDGEENKNTTMKCQTWKDVSKGNREIRNPVFFRGSLIKTIYAALEYITNVDYYFFGGSKGDLYRHEVGSFEYLSLREALVNAIAHRDYQIEGNEISVDCFPDRVEISSPGSFLLNKNTIREKLISFPSLRRNPTICLVMEKCRLMENEGSGFQAILDDYSHYGEEYAPLYSASSSSFTIILKNKKYRNNSQLTDNSLDDLLPYLERMKKEPMFSSRNELYAKNIKYREIELALTRNRSASHDEIAQEVSLSKDGVKYNIQRMKDACLLRRVGGPKNGYYEIVNDLDRPADILSLPKDDILKAINWCRENFKQANSFDSDHNSYGLKRILEEERHLYMTNGQFKAAMFLAGFKERSKEDLNWHFNISTTSKAFLSGPKAR